MWRTSSSEFLSYQPNSSMSAVAVIVQRRRTLWRPQKCSLAQQDAEKSWTVAWLPVLWRRWPFCWAAESLRDLESRRSSHSANHQLCARQSSNSSPLRCDAAGFLQRFLVPSLIPLPVFPLVAMVRKNQPRSFRFLPSFLQNFSFVSQRTSIVGQHADNDPSRSLLPVPPRLLMQEELPRAPASAALRLPHPPADPGRQSEDAPRPIRRRRLRMRAPQARGRLVPAGRAVRC